MTERLAEIEARLKGMRQLGAVVGAMRGIAAARGGAARAALGPAEDYAAGIADALARVLPLAAPDAGADAGQPRRRALVLLSAEQGFAGAFSAHVLDAAQAEAPGAEWLLVGSRGMALAAERGLPVAWSAAMPAHIDGLPRLADHLVDALYARLAAGAFDRLDVVLGGSAPGRSTEIEWRGLLPLRLPAAPPRGGAPLFNLAPPALAREFTAAHLHAQLCVAALRAFAAENQARMETMAAAHRQVQRELGELGARQRQIRQDEITAEIIELAAGESAGRTRR